MCVRFKMKNRIIIDEIINTDKNIAIGINKDENIIENIQNSLRQTNDSKQPDLLNYQQLADLEKTLFIGEFSTDKRVFFFTKPLFFSMDNPLYEINYLTMTLDSHIITVVINYTPNMKYLHHELINPLNTIYNAAMLINLETENSSIKRMIEPYIRIIHNQVDNCNHISKTFLYTENSYQQINLFMYLKSYLYDYYNSYNYLIDFDREKMKEYAQREYMIRIPRNIIYFKIILDNIFKNAIFHTKKDSNVRLDFDVCSDNRFCKLEIINMINSGFKDNTSSKLLNISQSHYVGMELISKLCERLGFKWNLVQNDNKIIFTLDIPVNIPVDIPVDIPSTSNPLGASTMVESSVNLFEKFETYWV